MWCARCVRVCSPWQKAGVCTDPRHSALWWRLRVLCSRGDKRAGPGCSAGGGGGSSPRHGALVALPTHRAPPPPPSHFGPRAGALWAEFPLPLSCLGRASCSGKASCRGRASCPMHCAPCRAFYIRRASFHSLPHCPGAMGSGLPAAHYLTAQGQHTVELHLNVALLPKGSGQWNSFCVLPHCLGAVGSGAPAVHCLNGQWAVELVLYTALLPMGSGH